MPIPLTTNAPTLFIRREAFERSGITRQAKPDIGAYERTID